MNVKELIEKIEALPAEDYNRPYIDKKVVLALVRQLDEPQKVTVPPEVSVWYQINKDNLDKNIAYLCLHNFGDFINDKTLFNWMSNTDNFIQILVNMHQFGYEVEKEPKYIMKIKGVSGYRRCINKKISSGEYFFASEKEVDGYRTKHTRKEIENAGFGWVFDCEGVEVEEVTE